jgi:hypothetical protein
VDLLRGERILSKGEVKSSSLVSTGGELVFLGVDPRSFQKS